MEKGKKIRYFQVLRALLVFAVGMLLLTGCSGNTEGTIYLTGVSRLKIVVKGDGKVKETRALNKAGSILLGEGSWKGEASDAALDVIVPLLQGEDAETVYVDVFSDDKTWETNEAQRLTEKYSDLGEDETPVEVRRIKDIDSMEEAWNGEAVSAAYEETEETAEEETSPQETGEEETSLEETTEEETETEETATEAPTTAAPTTAAERTQPVAKPTRAAARPTAAGTTAALPETTAPGVTETLPPEETLPQTPETTEAAPETTEPETTAPETTDLEVPPVSEKNTEEETTRSSVYIPPSQTEAPYGPGWTEEE